MFNKAFDYGLIGRKVTTNHCHVLNVTARPHKEAIYPLTTPLQRYRISEVRFMQKRPGSTFQRLGK
jgi:hypothetical protein